MCEAKKKGVKRLKGSTEAKGCAYRWGYLDGLASFTRLEGNPNDGRLRLIADNSVVGETRRKGRRSCGKRTSRRRKTLMEEALMDSFGLRREQTHDGIPEEKGTKNSSERSTE